MVEDTLRRSLLAAERIGLRLRWSLEDVRALVPFDAEAVERMDRATADATDAFLKRFESLVSQMQDQVWPQLLVAEGEDPEAMSRRDVVERMEKFHLVESARSFRKAAELRNRLSHAYPYDPARIARRLNDAHELAPVVLDALARAQGWAVRRLGPEA
jgi:hypothetical protein